MLRRSYPPGHHFKFDCISIEMQSVIVEEKILFLKFTRSPQIQNSKFPCDWMEVHKISMQFAFFSSFLHSKAEARDRFPVYFGLFI